MPDPIPVQPRRSGGDADAGTLVRLGELDPQPVPSTDPFLEPAWPPDEPADE
ncbi:hypothetical protein [Streptomyces sp. NPDC008150]|uniref:hypothetical protein n=1 Tax=Streptomyces sp. NPDC008150 TaxID=3364816 RepID=UPI0036E1F53C